MTSIPSGPASDTEASRVLALDPGERRVGLAISDRLGVIACGLPTLAYAGETALLRAIAGIVEEEGVARVIVGWPLRLSGAEGPEAAAARRLAEALERKLALPVELWDERLTSVQAERAMLEGGTRRRQRQGQRDRLAAVLILQSWLDAHAGAGEG